MKAWTLAALLIAAVLAERVVARPDGAQDDDEEVQDDEPANEDGASPPAGLPPKILTSPQILTRKEGETVILPCVVENENTVAWLNKSHSKISTLAIGEKRLSFANDNRITIHPDHSLEIKNLTLFDAGEYTCKVNEGLQVHHQLVLNGAPVTRISISLLLGVVVLLLTRL